MSNDQILQYEQLISKFIEEKTKQVRDLTNELYVKKKLTADRLQKIKNEKIEEEKLLIDKRFQFLDKMINFVKSLLHDKKTIRDYAEKNFVS